MEQWYRNGELFNSEQAVRNDNKGSSLPHFLGSNDIEVPMVVGMDENNQPIIEIKLYKRVVDIKPTITAAQYLVEGEVVEVNGIPTKQYTVVDYTAEELQAMQAEAMAKLVQHFTDVTTAYIEGKVQEYNKANGLAFKDIDAFTKYAVTPTSVHNAIANRFISYADKVWTAVRTYQATATTAPTDEEFKAILDSVVF